MQQPVTQSEAAINTSKQSKQIKRVSPLRVSTDFLNLRRPIWPRITASKVVSYHILHEAKICDPIDICTRDNNKMRLTQDLSSPGLCLFRILSRSDGGSASTCHLKTPFAMYRLPIYVAHFLPALITWDTPSCRGRGRAKHSPNMRTIEFHQKSNKTMFLILNQDIQGDLLRHQKSPEMTFDSTRLHETWFQEVTFLKILKILSKMLTRAHVCTRNRNLRWT